MNGENVLKFIDKNIAINKSIGIVGGIDLMALKNELVETIEKADKWDEKETPYKPITKNLIPISVNAYTFDAYCRCGYKINDSFRYCPNCSQKLDFESGE